MSNAIFGIAAARTPLVGQGLGWDGAKYEPTSSIGPASSLTGVTQYRVAVGNASTGIDGAANLTFDGSTLTLTGAQTMSGVLTVSNSTAGGTSGTGAVLITGGVSILARSFMGDAFVFERASATSGSLQFQVTADASSRLVIFAGGQMSWGPGSASRDVGMGRNAAGVLEINSTTAGTLRDLTLRNLAATGPISTTDATASSSSSTGSLVTGGGLGVGGNLFSAGGTAQFGPGSSSVNVNINGGAASSRSLQFYSGGSLRWIFQVNSTAESGSNAGSDFQIVARDDTGGAIDTPISIARVSGGTATISRPVSITNTGTALSLSGDANLASGKVLKVNSTQVVAARDTGWTAMTGTPDKATAYATSTVTLAQLAGRVAQLQATITTHGLIGT